MSGGEPRDHKVTAGVWARKLDREVLEMYDRKSAPTCPAPLGGHGKGKKSVYAIVRKDGRLLEFACEVCCTKVGKAYESEEQD